MPTEAEYIRQLGKSRKEKDERIRQNPRSWLALTGLFWLQQGDNAVGSNPNLPICLPGLNPNQELTLTVEGLEVHYHTTPGSEFTLYGEPAISGNMQTDQTEQPDILQAGSISLMVIIRADQPYLRVWDSASDQVQQFNGLHYFPIRPDYCVQAWYLPFPQPVSRPIQNAIGNEEEAFFAGEVVFTWQNVECHLMAQLDEEELLLNFTDLTRADSTYPAGRYLTIPIPTTAEIILDFNRAANWPCAYTPYATCPLPLRENALPVRIEAGEMRYHTE
jgi:uncharacterized protein